MTLRLPQRRPDEEPGPEGDSAGQGNGSATNCESLSLTQGKQKQDRRREGDTAIVGKQKNGQDQSIGEAEPEESSGMAGGACSLVGEVEGQRQKGIDLV